MYVYNTEKHRVTKTPLTVLGLAEGPYQVCLDPSLRHAGHTARAKSAVGAYSKAQPGCMATTSTSARALAWERLLHSAPMSLG